MCTQTFLPHRVEKKSPTYREAVFLLHQQLFCAFLCYPVCCLSCTVEFGDTQATYLVLCLSALPSVNHLYTSSSPPIFSSAAVPTSFEGPFGKIVYRVKATIDTPRFSKDYKVQKPFYILNMLNLNEVPDIDVSL